MEIAVVGHTEWVHFLRVPRLPLPGEIVAASRAWAGPAGGGAMAAFEARRQVAAQGSVHFFTAHGDDDVGRWVRAALDERGLVLHAARRAAPHPQVFTYLTDDHERTITLLGRPLSARGDDALDWPVIARCDAAYFCKGDAAAVVHARRARRLVATARALPVLAEARVPVDVLVGSAVDASERYARGDLDPEPSLVVRTQGARGGTWESRDGARGAWQAAPLPGAIADAYGTGDSFAAALTVALGAGASPADALGVAARAGAAAVCREGAG